MPVNNSARTHAALEKELEEVKKMPESNEKQRRITEITRALLMQEGGKRRRTRRHRTRRHRTHRH